MSDAGKNLAELMGNQDEGGLAQRDLFEILKQLTLGAKVKACCRFVEHQGLGAMDNGAGQECSATFSGGHRA